MTFCSAVFILPVRHALSAGVGVGVGVSEDDESSMGEPEQDDDDDASGGSSGTGFGGYGGYGGYGGTPTPAPVTITNPSVSSEDLPTDATQPVIFGVSGTSTTVQSVSLPTTTSGSGAQTATISNPISIVNDVIIPVPSGVTATINSTVETVSGKKVTFGGAGNTKLEGAINNVAGGTVRLEGTGNAEVHQPITNAAGSRVEFASTGDTTVSASISNAANSVVALSGAGNAAFSAPMTSVDNTSKVSVSGGKAVTFAVANPGLSSAIELQNSTAIISDNANIGTGTLKLQSAGTGSAPVVQLGATTLSNPIAMETAATFEPVAGKTPVLTGAFSGTAPMTIAGGVGSELKLNGDSPNYSGSIGISSGTASINGSMPNASVSVASGGMLKGNGVVGATTIGSGGYGQGGQSIGYFSPASLSIASGGHLVVEVNNYTTPNIVLQPSGHRLDSTYYDVAGDATFANGSYIDLVMQGGDYSAGVRNYEFLKAGGTLSIASGFSMISMSNGINFRYVEKPGLSVDVGPSSDGKKLILKVTTTSTVNISGDQSVDSTTGEFMEGGVAVDPSYIVTVTGNDNTGVITIDPTDLYTSPLTPDHSSQIINAVTNSATLKADSNTIAAEVGPQDFRARQFSATKGGSLHSNNESFERILTALADKGPVSMGDKETRVWVTPFASRMRVDRTSSDTGSQGWTGGSLIGVERRNLKNTYSFGLMTGLTAARSHTLGDPDSFQKANGYILGVYNTYKYTKNWGHELVFSRANTFNDGQRYGIDKTKNNTPYYALQTYKTSSDLANAQLNYLFDIVRKQATGRINAGLTYTGSKASKFTERNAGRYGITQNESTSNGMEWYTGLGLRYIIEQGKTTFRLTGVYEYGIELDKKGSGTKYALTTGPSDVYTTSVGPNV